MDEYTNLVISGAGIKNYATIGALEHIGDERIKKFKRFLGVSSGSILSTLLALGCTTNKIKELYSTVDMKKYKVKYTSIYTYYKLFMRNGIYDSEDFREDIIHKILEKVTGNGNITFKDVHEKYNKILVIASACINRREMFYYQYSSNPNMRIKDAIEQSCAIPGVFTPVRYKGDTMVDGGVIDNYPFYFFHEEHKTPNSKTSLVFDKNDAVNEKTIGIMTVDSNKSKLDDTAYLGNDSTSNISEIIKAVFNTLLTTNERKSIKKNYWQNTITIDVGFVDALENLPTDRLEELYQKGKTSAESFFQNKQSSTSITSGSDPAT